MYMFTALEGDDTVRGITIQICVCAQLLKLYVTMCTHTALEGDDTIRCGALHVHNLICLFPFKKNHRYRKVKLGCSILKKWKRGVL